MRGIIRKAAKIDSMFWIIALSFLVLGIYVTFGLPNADAISRADYEVLEAEALAAENKIKDYDDQLEDQRKLIKEHELIINNLKNDREKVSNLSDWESLRLKAEFEKAVQDAEVYAKELRDNLGDILTLKSDSIKFLKSLDLNNITLDKPTSLTHLDTKIGISLSKSCEIMVKNNFETNCPTYKQLVQLDSSNTDISGKFTTDENGFFHRGDEKVVNSYKFYWNDKTIRIFVDPPASMTDRIKMIYIEPNFDTYTIAGDMTVQDEFETFTGNYTKTFGNNTELVEFDYRSQTEYFGTVLYHDRYIDKCNTATINADNWKFLIGDTIHLMRNECDRNVSQFEEREVILPEYSVIDITTSPNWIYQQWLKHTEEFCIFKYKQC